MSKPEFHLAYATVQESEIFWTELISNYSCQQHRWKHRQNCQWYLAYYPIKFVSPFVKLNHLFWLQVTIHWNYHFKTPLNSPFLPLFHLNCSNSPLSFLQQQRFLLESNQDMTWMFMKKFISLNRYIYRFICFYQNNLYHSFQFLTWTVLCWLRSLHLQWLSNWSHAENISLLFQRQINKQQQQQKATKQSISLILLKFLQ